MNLQNTGILITGAGRGLGRALALALAGEGSRLFLVARTRAEVEETAAEARALGADAHAFVADLAHPASAAVVAAVAQEKTGPIDVLVHNASELGPVPLRLLLDTESPDFQRVLEANLLAPFRLTRALAGPMVLRGGGLVVHVTSDAGRLAYPAWGAYGVSKAALDHLARIWAAELEGTGVRFLTVDPGEMATRMHADAIPDADRSTLRDPADAARAIVTFLKTSTASPAERFEIGAASEAA